MALGLGFLGVDFGELFDPGHDAGRGHARQLGGAVHRQPAQVEEHRRDLDPERHAARRRVGEVQPAGPAAVALLAAHEPVLDVLLAPAPLAPQRHPFTPSATPPPMDMGNLCGVETLKLPCPYYFFRIVFVFKFLSVAFKFSRDFEDLPKFTGARSAATAGWPGPTSSTSRPRPRSTLPA